jgi:hypothetical protein
MRIIGVFDNITISLSRTFWGTALIHVRMRYGEEGGSEEDWRAQRRERWTVEMKGGGKRE